MNVDQYDAYPWDVQVERDQGEAGALYYVARQSEFPYLIGTGPTPEQALAELRDARRAAIVALLERGDPIPPARPLASRK